MRPIVMIPARMAASRLPGKPMADIGGEPMIVHVWRRAIAAAIGDVVVATDSEEIAGVVRAAGGRAQMTRDDHPSGSDRIHEAITAIDPEGRFDVVVNVQGDLPLISPQAIRAVFAAIDHPDIALGTLVAKIEREEERTASQVVKMVGSETAPGRFRCLYFTRATAPWGDGPLWHHIGLYAWRRSALARFVALPPSPLETREKLEQLRALEAGMRIDAVAVDDVPLGVDTPADLHRARQLHAQGHAQGGAAR
ncbi:3-deoxy-manno-octulosonate cytidylyltransferase [Falsiroseomonas stagni]|uniref:3-deoxy-manno-octulosonate cytidylyltransferase n=1 Tax=Falsiroseomonas stagni DSM 19981 TaxID=1123062 RepID=A0A1I4AXB1_9PROT|nr:3-deoxy-manno-octulosonate cytidylyltransferase [Falsiroseomonas stagni]SFK61125.1 3-deoxy-manno-octulosonate cytidylyltransferase (CMP-KDO synthetase) [Falsiroseomonas stagni DSM 19981]